MDGWKIGRLWLVSFWDVLFSCAMLVLGSVTKIHQRLFVLPLTIIIIMITILGSSDGSSGSTSRITRVRTPTIVKRTVNFRWDPKPSNREML